MKLKLAEGLSLPLDAVTQKLAWLGVTGSGKTYGASKLAELFWHAGAQFVVLDPVGVWYGLRLQKDGKKPSDITIPIFGGLHGDVPLEATGGALLANLVVDKTLSAIIDVSQFESDTDKARFARDFAERFFFRKKAAPSAVHLFLEECQEFVPQNPQRGEEHMLHAYIRMQKLGRNFGIGSSYISQRPQEVNKKALNMAQTLFVFRTTGTHERKAIESWITDKALDQDIAGDLPKIATGDCHVWSPEFLKISDTVHILEKHTFNASATPEVGVTAKSRELAPIDLAQVRSDMAATIEKAKSDDPRELRKQIAELKKQLVSKVDPTRIQPEPRVREKFVLKDSQIARLEKIYERMLEKADAYGKAMGLLWDQQSDEAKALLDVLRVVANVPKPPPASVHKFAGRRDEPTSRALPASTPRPRAELGSRVRQPQSSSNGDAAIGNSGLRRMLIALAQRPQGLNRRQLGVRAALSSRSGTFDTYLSKARTNGWVDGTNQLRITDAGSRALGSYDPLPEGRDLLEHWLRELGNSGAARILRELAGAYPRALTRAELGEAANLSDRSGTFDEYLSKLRTLELIEGRGELRASEELFS